MKAIVTVGVSASGKTTWANQQNSFMAVSRDDIRRMLLEEQYDRELSPGELWKLWKFKNERLVTDRYDHLLVSYAHSKRNVICADTNLNPTFRKALIDRLVELGYDVEVKEFPVTLREAWERDSRRADGVGHQVIYKQYQQWLEYIGRVRYSPNKSLPNAVIVDIDGTLANMDGKRGPYEWEKIHLDSVNKHVKDVVNSLYSSGYYVIVLSGRDGVCYEATRKWLEYHGIGYHKFYMRTAFDMRHDAEIKEEIFWKNIAHRYNVVMAIDDRPVMCRCWMELGIPVMNVGNPWVEF